MPTKTEQAREWVRIVDKARDYLVRLIAFSKLFSSGIVVNPGVFSQDRRKWNRIQRELAAEGWIEQWGTDKAVKNSYIATHKAYNETEPERPDIKRVLEEADKGSHAIYGITYNNLTPAEIKWVAERPTQYMICFFRDMEALKRGEVYVVKNGESPSIAAQAYSDAYHINASDNAAYVIETKLLEYWTARGFKQRVEETMAINLKDTLIEKNLITKEQAKDLWIVDRKSSPFLSDALPVIDGKHPEKWAEEFKSAIDSCNEKIERLVKVREMYESLAGEQLQSILDQLRGTCETAVIEWEAQEKAEREERAAKRRAEREERRK